MVGASTEMLSHQLDNSTIDMPHTIQGVSPHINPKIPQVPIKPSILQVVKVEKLDPVIELSSESKGESPELITKNVGYSIGTTIGERIPLTCTSRSPSNLEL